jgi:TonB-linked SusC/RagA family outer membrane protein
MLKWFRIPLFVLVCTSPLWKNSLAAGQDSLPVSGTITGSHNEPIQGVAVSIEGVYDAPAITDSSGKFQLVSPEGDAWLLIVPVDTYKSRRIYLNNRRELSIQLTAADMESGYDEVGNLFRPGLRRNILSAYHSPDAEKSLFYPNPSIDQYFQGHIPGFLATIQSGMPGAGATSYLRGMRSLYTNNQPLYIVDGLPLEDPGIFQSNLSGYAYNPMFSIDPMDITNITILKDYLGSAVYGMRGSNGVVLIETLKPTEIQTRIVASFRTGLSLEPRQITQLNSRQYKTLANEVLMTSGSYEEDYKMEYFPIYATEDNLEYYKYNNNTNWQDEIYRNALMNDFYLRIHGGDEIARYGLSVGYLNHQGIIKETNASRFNVRFVGSFNVFQWLSMYISSSLVNTQASMKESALSRETSPILTSLFKSPMLVPYQFDKNGGQLKTLEEVNSLGTSNPVAIINKFEGRNSNTRFATSFRVEANLWQEYIKLTSLLGINFNSLNENVFMPNSGMELYYDREAWNAAKSLKNYLYSFYNDNYISYKQEFNRRHLVTAAAGLRIHQNRFEIDWGVAKNAHKRDEYKQLQNGVSYLREMGGECSRWNRLGIYSNLGYSFRNKYFIGANLITEYSSRTGKNASDVMLIGGEPFGLFYSLGAAWRLSGESFLRDIPWLEDLKLRASYGRVGNDDIGNLSALDYFTVVHYRETSGMIPGTVTDQSIKFEVNRQMNAGLDLGILGNRLFLTFDLYNTKTEDLLVFEPQPTFTGFVTIPANNGEISNKGWETGLHARVFEKNKIKWDLALNLAKFTNTVDAIKDDAVITPFEGGQFISKVGQPILSFYGYQYNRVYATSDEAADQARRGGLTTEKGVPFGAGDAKFNDLSGSNGTPDGIINEFDWTIIGSPVPDVFGGISNTFRYGRWSLSATLQFVLGQEVFNYLRYQNEKMTNISNQSSNTLNRWTTEGQLTDVPRALYMDPIGNADFSTRWIENGSYLRLKHITLAYTIPEKIWFLRNLEVFATATNLFTWSKYLGYDPEFSFSYYTMEQGIDYGMMPHTRNFILGLSIGL